MTTRERILRAATDVYEQRGRAGFSMRNVATRAQLTATAIYRHFENKEELVRAITDRARARLQQNLMEAARGSTPLERLRACGEGYVRFAQETPQLYRLLFVDPLEEDVPQFPEGASEERTPPFLFIVERVDECIRAGVLRPGDPVSITVTVWGLVHGLCMLWLSGRFPPERFLALYEASLDRLLEGLLAPV